MRGLKLSTTVRRPRRSAAPFNCGEQDEPTWDERARDAAQLWAAHAPAGRCIRVADFGAGNERLRRHLARRLRSAQWQYVPFDLHPQRPTTRALDVYRELPGESFDVVFCLGLLEYLPELRSFLERLRSRCEFALVSYVFVDQASDGLVAARASVGWVSHATREGFEREFMQVGYRLVDFRLTNAGRTGLWLWSAHG